MQVSYLEPHISHDAGSENRTRGAVSVGTSVTIHGQYAVRPRFVAVQGREHLKSNVIQVGR
jgi:hypothetical protein